MRALEDRAIESRPFPRSRRYVAGAIRRTPMMQGLVTVDVTESLAALRSTEPPGSLTAFVIAAVARCVSRHPEVHAYRNWSGRLVVPRFVDVAALIESKTSAGLFPLAHLVKNADVRTVQDIGDEIRSVASDQTSSRTGRLLRWIEVVPVPGLLIRAAYWSVRRSTLLRRITGSVTVSSVGMFGGRGGHAIGVPSTATLSVTVGGLSRQACVMEGDRIEPRDMLDLTVSADHAILDGAPLTRFVADLCRALEKPIA